MRELYVGSRAAEDETGRNHEFDYYILIGEMDTGRFFCESYGVRISQRGTAHRCDIPNITTSAVRIDGLMELLLENAATPVNLPEIVADWL